MRFDIKTSSVPQQGTPEGTRVRSNTSNIVLTATRDQLKKQIPDFRPGDTLRVAVRIIEGDKERIQNFEGVCIGRSGEGMDAMFTVRRVSFGIGMERNFPLHSPRIESITVLRHGRVRRAKLYYLRDLTGKKARLSETRRKRLDKGHMLEIVGEAESAVQAPEAAAEAESPEAATAESKS
jgi:large subunit ribosomal protein L19